MSAPLRASYDASRIVPVVRLVRNSDFGECRSRRGVDDEVVDGRIEAAIGKIAQIGESLDEVKHVVADEPRISSAFGCVSFGRC